MFAFIFFFNVLYLDLKHFKNNIVPRLCTQIKLESNLNGLICPGPDGYKSAIFVLSKMFDTENGRGVPIAQNREKKRAKRGTNVDAIILFFSS